MRSRKVESLSVVETARFLGVSPQRVRALLGARRLMAAKDEGGAWRVAWPLQLRAGRRGPSLTAARSGRVAAQILSGSRY